MVHPRGKIEVDVKQTDGTLSGSVKLPSGLTGTIFANGHRHEFRETHTF
jgi:hypothetical protein